jgi:hypothetical protein
MKIKKELFDIVLIIPTPFTEKEETGEDALQRLIDWDSGGVGGYTEKELLISRGC